MNQYCGFGNASSKGSYHGFQCIGRHNLYQLSLMLVHELFNLRNGITLELLAQNTLSS
jgi:hypothetical protein